MFVSCVMTPDEFKAALDDLQLRQNQAAELLGVTTRAVGMWVNNEREIPGPVAAYLTLLLSLPGALRAKELARHRKDNSEMFEGMYRVDYVGAAGFGAAVLVFKDGEIFGYDEGQVSYDGTYNPTGVPGEVSLKVTLSVPPGVPLVQGFVAGHSGYTFDVGPVRVNLSQPEKVFDVATPVNKPNGTVRGRIRKLRNLPN